MSVTPSGPRSWTLSALVLIAACGAPTSSAHSNACCEAPTEGHSPGSPEAAAETSTAETTANPATNPAPLRVAITFDDLPSHGPTLVGESPASIHRALIDTLAQHGIRGAYGFVNGAKLEESRALRTVLTEWRNAGHHLANHTWSHFDVGEVGAERFVADIERNDALLANLVGDDDPSRIIRRTFRYPYLRLGRDQDTVDTVMAYLRQHGYRFADVTIDFGDWAYNPAYVRCTAAGAEAAVATLRQDFVGRAVGALRWSEATAQRIFGRSIAHILLLHSGSFDAAALDALLSAYEEEGVRWISLDDALEDPAYDDPVAVPAHRGGTLLERRIARDNAPHPPFQREAAGLLAHVCQGA